MSIRTQYVRDVAATIAASGNLSAAVNISGAFSLVAIKYPAAWDAAGIAFQVSLDGIDWEILRDDVGNEIAKTVTAGQFRELDSSEFKSAIWLKIRSGTSAAPVTQTAERIFTLYSRRYA